MMTLHEAARAVQSEWTGSDVLFTSVSTDTRTLQPGSLFIALSGEHFDGLNNRKWQRCFELFHQ